MREHLPFTLEDARRWKETYPTPFYIYDEEGIRDCVKEIYEAFSWNEGFKEYFCCKSNAYARDPASFEEPWLRRGLCVDP